MWRDDSNLFDMLTASRRVVQFTRGMTWPEFESDDLIQSAVVRQLEIVGEAAKRVSEETRKAQGGIPWDDIIGMRNRLIHEYFRVDLRRVWDTITNDVPELIRLLEPIVPPEESVP